MRAGKGEEESVEGGEDRSDRVGFHKSVGINRRRVYKVDVLAMVCGLHCWGVLSASGNRHASEH